MITTFLLATPNWLKAALGAALLIGALQVKHTIHDHGLNKQIATLTQQLDHERVVTAELRQGIAEVQSNRDKLQSTIKDQNLAIEGLQRQASQSNAAADARARAALQKKLVAALPPGNKEMNSWLAKQFSSRSR